MKCGWYDTPREVARHELGAQVGEPSHALGCWACLSPNGRPTTAVKARGCSMRARAGKLTCNAHRKLEGAAQALKKQLDAQRAQGAA